MKSIIITHETKAYGTIYIYGFGNGFSYGIYLSELGYKGAVSGHFDGKQL